MKLICFESPVNKTGCIYCLYITSNLRLYNFCCKGKVTLWINLFKKHRQMYSRAAPHVPPAAPDCSGGSPVMKKRPLTVRRWRKTWISADVGHESDRVRTPIGYTVQGAPCKKLTIRLVCLTTVLSRISKNMSFHCCLRLRRTQE